MIIDFDSFFGKESLEDIGVASFQFGCVGLGGQIFLNLDFFYSFEKI